MSEYLKITRTIDEDGNAHVRLYGEFPEVAGFDPYFLMCADPSVIGATLIVTVNLEDAAATYVWRNDTDETDRSVFSMRRVTAWDKEATNGTE